MEMIGQKIKELRIKKGLTQEELAERTNLSVRTIQRIESGDVDPRTYTLNLLAEALDVELETLTTEKAQKAQYTQKPMISEAEKTKWLALLHISGMFAFLIPPLIVYLWKKEEVPDMEKHFTDVMNFQISVIVYILVSVAAVLIVVGVVLLPLIGIASTAIIILNSIKVLNGNEYRYPFSIKFLK
jgi:transcriptional regulator with XRE-family HTH domain